MDRGVVAQEQPIARPFRRGQVHHHQHVRGLLAGDDPLPHHVLRQPGLRDGHPVLHVDRGDVGVGADREGDGQRVAPAVGAGRRHVEHPVDAVDLGLDGRGHRFLHHLCVRPRIAGGHLDLGRGDVGELRDRDGADGDQPGQHDHDGDDEGELRPGDEESGEHGGLCGGGGGRGRCGKHGGGYGGGGRTRRLLSNRHQGRHTAAQARTWRRCSSPDSSSLGPRRPRPG